MKNKTYAGIGECSVKTSMAVEAIYPLKGSKLDTSGALVRDMETMGIVLTPKQALEFALKIQVAVANLDEQYNIVRITGQRKSNSLTVLRSTRAHITSK